MLLLYIPWRSRVARKRVFLQIRYEHGPFLLDRELFTALSLAGLIRYTHAWRKSGKFVAQQ